MSQFSDLRHPHRRRNPLTGEWVLVSPHRMQRPWQGQVEKTPPEERPAYDPQCYLCPGNQRAGGARNPHYENTFVFTNDYAALLPQDPTHASLEGNEHPLLQGTIVRGTSRVVCFSPRHDLTLPEMALDEIVRVIDVWAQQTAELGRRYRWIQVFQNKGIMMGSSNPHPHGQICALDTLPNEPFKEDAQQRAYLEEYNQPLLVDYAQLEIDRRERLVLQNDCWLVLVPFWAVWPFELLLLPRRHVPRLPDLLEEERQALAHILRRLLIRYDNLFETSFPYSMGWHGAPHISPAGDENDHWQLHAHFYPPLLRSATIKKFMVGYEMLGEAQRDLTAEQAAARLRELSDRHYRS